MLAARLLYPSMIWASCLRLWSNRFAVLASNGQNPVHDAVDITLNERLRFSRLSIGELLDKEKRARARAAEAIEGEDWHVHIVAQTLADDFITLVVQVWLAAWNFPVPGCVYLCTMAARTGEAIVDILQWKPCRVATELSLEDKEALVLVAVAFTVRDWAIAVAGNNIRAGAIRLAHK